MEEQKKKMGRKKKFGKRVTFRLTDIQYDTLTKLAAILHLEQGETVRRAIQTLYELKTEQCTK
jgi:flagellin-specific chaperone FliS